MLKSPKPATELFKIPSKGAYLHYLHFHNLKMKYLFQEIVCEEIVREIVAESKYL